MTLPNGLYDRVVTDAIARALADLPADASSVEQMPSEDAPERLMDVLTLQLRRILDDFSGTNPERLGKQLALVNGLMAEIRERYKSRAPLLDIVSEPARLLRSVHPAGTTPPRSPETGLSAPWLFTAGKGSPSLLEELRREASSCDQIDILVSFITVAGVRKLAEVLRSITAPNAQGVGRTRIRVLTTTYTGATEQAALDQLAGLNGCEVKLSLDGRRTRLHAKAWIFQRRTGFGSAYVGSANLSGAALLGGLEWTVKFTERGQGGLFERAKAHFATLWEDDEFQRYDPNDASLRAAVAAALSLERGELAPGTVVHFDIQPKHYQREMLAALEHARLQGRHRNLVVAATGTGKTVVAALDYRQCAERLGHRPRLLFVAHRAQILRQALAVYRAVLRDSSFGELFTGGVTLTQHDFLFASIDSLASRDLVARLGADYWHTVVIDECHRMAAARFNAFVTAVRPAELLGLTATPERTDGQSLGVYFDARPDQSPAIELRLWDALDMQLLAPFEYYASDDATDFTEVPWDGPGEAAAIAARIAQNADRARLVVTEWHRLASSPRTSRAIAFCVSVEHARFMASYFTENGLPADVVVGETAERDRVRAIDGLKTGRLCVLVTVDLFNEGVDLPTVDTLLLLRPTQSALLFQQQIGRGLRLSPGKTGCLILDFVGQHKVDFRFDRLLSSITGLTRTALTDAVQNGFHGLPPGCHIHLALQAREQVLGSLRALSRHRWRHLATELQAYSAIAGIGSVTLGSFLRDQGIDIDDVYRQASPSGWTSLRRAAGMLPGDIPESEGALSRDFRYMLHVDDPSLLACARRVAERGPDYHAEGPVEARRALMLAYQLDTSNAPTSVRQLTERLDSAPFCEGELIELVDVLTAKSQLVERPIPGLEDVPLSLHGSYRIREILTAVGQLTEEARVPFQAGVLSLPARRTELLFVTLDKSEGFHDAIAYHDYAISPELFHWQTQNAAGPDTPAGKRYIESTTNGWQFQLFVRLNKDAPYRACGLVRINSPEDVSGDRPMSITWHISEPLPATLFREFSVLRG